MNGLKSNGTMKEEILGIRSIFIKVAPSIFPMLNCKFPFFMTVIDVINSGIAIPMASMKKPIVDPVILNLFANSNRLSMQNFPDSISSMEEHRRVTKLNLMVLSMVIVWLFLFASIIDIQNIVIVIIPIT